MDHPNLEGFSPNAVRVLRQAQVEAQKLQHDHVGRQPSEAWRKPGPPKVCHGRRAP